MAKKADKLIKTLPEVGLSTMTIRYQWLKTKKEPPLTQKARGLWHTSINGAKEEPKLFSGLLLKLDDCFLASIRDTDSKGDPAGKPGWPVYCKDCFHNHNGFAACDKNTSCQQCKHEHEGGKCAASILAVGSTPPAVCECARIYKKCACVKIPEKLKRFARGCPKRPRHGFTESVVVLTEEEARQAFIAALNADSEAELILMPYLEAKSSAIYIPESGALVVGPGHDGATAGKNSTVIPVNVMTVSDKFREATGIGTKDHVYVELVDTGDQKESVTSSVRVVQARSGPPQITGVSEYIPKQLVVENIIQPTGDLLAWETLTESLKGTKGLVAWQHGGNLFDHAAIHSKGNGIPFLTREHVKVGDILYPPEQKPAEFVAAEFCAGVSSIPENYKRSLTLAIGLLHNDIQLTYSPQYSRLIGYSVSVIFRAAAMACLGELRHAKGKMVPGLLKAVGTGESLLGLSRQQIYEKGAAMKLPMLQDKLTEHSLCFIYGDSWGGGFGGWKWFACAVQAAKLYNLISECRVKSAVKEANKLLNMAHNNGWLFNKFIQQNVMNTAASNPGSFLAGRITDLLGIVGLPTTTQIKRRKQRKAGKWPLAVGDAVAGKVTLKAAEIKLIPTPWDVIHQGIINDYLSHV